MADELTFDEEIPPEEVYRRGYRKGKELTSKPVGIPGAMSPHLTPKTWKKLPQSVRDQITRRNEAMGLSVVKLREPPNQSVDPLIGHIQSDTTRFKTATFPEDAPVVGKPWSDEEQILRDARKEADEKYKRYIGPLIDLQEPGFKRRALEAHYGQTIPELHGEWSMSSGKYKSDPATGSATSYEAGSGFWDDDQVVEVDRLVGKVPETSPRLGDKPKKDTTQKQIDSSLVTLADIKEAQNRLNDTLLNKAPNNEELQEITRAQERLAGQEADLTQKISDLRIKTAQKDLTTREILRKGHKAGEDLIRGEISVINQKITDHEIDPRRAFKSTWQVIGAAVAAAAGAFAQGLHSRNIPNTAMLLIERAINRDIDAQKAELTKMGRQSKMLQNVLGHLIGANQDEDRSLAEAQIVAYDVSKMRLDKLAAETKSLQVKQAAIYLRRELELKSAETTHKAMVQAATGEVNNLLRIFDAQNRGSRKAGSTESLDPVKLARKFSMFVGVIKDLDIGKGVLNLSDATRGRMTETLKDWFGPTVAAEFASMDPEGERLYKNYSSYGLLVITELAKSYQGKHLSDRDMKSYMAVLPDISMITTEEMRKVAIQRMEDLQTFFLQPEFAQGDSRARSELIFEYALENGNKPVSFYTDDKATFEDPEKQRRLEIYRDERAARNR